MESSTNVSISVSVEMTLMLRVDAAGKVIKIGGAKDTADGQGFVTLTPDT